MKKQKKAPSASGEIASGEASVAVGAAAVSGPRSLPVPPATQQHFLMIPVPRCATRRELVEAVAKALEVHDLPFFDNHHKIGMVPARKSVPGDCCQEGGGMGAGEGLVIFMKQEGWP